MRLLLTDVSLSPDSVLWVFGRTGDAVAFGAELLADGEIWTPAVDGDTIALVLPEGVRAQAVAVGHITRRVMPASVDCLSDATCHSGMDALYKATAALEYVKDGGIYVCTGTLINGAEGDRQLLTANHCINSASQAASVTATWDLRSTTCGGSVGSGTDTYGATLLATSAVSDVTLLRMNSLPSGRWLMGWSTEWIAPGTPLYRIAHPATEDGTTIYAQAFSTSIATSSGPTCSSAPRWSHIYSTREFGGVGPGSSGAAALIEDGYIVGQLRGGCASFGEPDGCSSSTYVMDGAFETSYQVLQPFIDAEASPDCVANATTACLLSNRFEVRVNYRNQFANPPTPGDFVAGRLNPNATNPDVGIFGLGTAQAVEIMVRIADARPFAPRFDVYYGGLTDLEYWINVTDMTTGTTRTYHNAPGKALAGVDRDSFPAN